MPKCPGHACRAAVLSYGNRFVVLFKCNKPQAVKFIPHDIPYELIHAFSNKIFFKPGRRDMLM